ncbi:MAG: hypothetical protein ACI9HK_002040, partial [Pirellulaceae bacterium]
ELALGRFSCRKSTITRIPIGFDDFSVPNGRS